jgi:hypothetical protein
MLVEIDFSARNTGKSIVKIHFFLLERFLNDCALIFLKCNFL